MAVGNTGRNLDLAADDLCTWLSQDGGVTWEDVYPGAGIYEFGDHGGILVLAPHRGEQPATHIKFSIDEGRCWHNISLAEAIDIENIRCGSFWYVKAVSTERRLLYRWHSSTAPPFAACLP